MEREPIISVVENVVKRLASEVIASRYIRRAVRDITGQTIADDRLKGLVEEGSSEFEKAVVEEIASVIKDDYVEEKVDQLWDIISKTDPNAKGWRPTGVPKLDVFGHIRPALLEHEEHLEQIKQKLLDELQESKTYLKKLRTEVDKFDDHSLGASAASALQL